MVSVGAQIRFMGRKGYPTQNVMVVCDWNMRFTFVLAGWEGTAYDAHIFYQALINANMNFPHSPPGMNIILYTLLILFIMIYNFIFY